MLRALAIIPLVACTASSGDEGMLIVQNSAVGDKCEFTAAMPPFNPHGGLYLNSPQPYLLTPLVESRISAEMGQESQRTVALHGARIDITIGAVEVIHEDGTVAALTFDASELATLKSTGVTHFKSLFAAPLPPNMGTSNVAFDVVPLAMLSSLRSKGALGAKDRMHAELIAKVVVFGDLGGDEVTSLPFEYPVTVCNDCIVSQPIPACPLPMATTVRTGNACNLFQDGVVDCCTDPTTKATVCPATVATM